jgi:lysophospholipase L1-like esterase
MTTFVALGDSITLGMGDPAPDGSWRGWAALLSDGLPAPQLHNLATLGAQSHHVESVQLPAALALRPDVASVIVGVNDTLRGGFDPARVGGAVARTVEALTACGAVVLTMRLPDPGQMLGVPNALARPLGRRMRAVNTELDAIAARYGTVHFDAADDSDTYDRRNWSVDRLHPNERGHRLIACRFWNALEAAGCPVGSPPDPEPSNPEPRRRDEVLWMATRGTAWVMRRSVDLIPYLLFITAREWIRGEPHAAATPGLRSEARREGVVSGAAGSEPGRQSEPGEQSEPYQEPLPGLGATGGHF